MLVPPVRNEHTYKSSILPSDLDRGLPPESNISGGRPFARPLEYRVIPNLLYLYDIFFNILFFIIFLRHVIRKVEIQ